MPLQYMYPSFIGTLTNRIFAILEAICGEPIGHSINKTPSFHRICDTFLGTEGVPISKGMYATDMQRLNGRAMELKVTNAQYCTADR